MVEFHCRCTGRLSTPTVLTLALPDGFALGGDGMDPQNYGLSCFQSSKMIAWRWWWFWIIYLSFYMNFTDCHWLQNTNSHRTLVSFNYLLCSWPDRTESTVWFSLAWLCVRRKVFWLTRNADRFPLLFVSDWCKFSDLSDHLDLICVLLRKSTGSLIEYIQRSSRTAELCRLPILLLGDIGTRVPQYWLKSNVN